MGKTIPYPLTSSDLDGVANVVAAVMNILKVSRIEENKSVFDINIDIGHPDADFPVGSIRFYDGWLGFFPYPVVEG
jgi:hypothetical protein